MNTVWIIERLDCGNFDTAYVFENIRATAASAIQYVKDRIVDRGCEDEIFVDGEFSNTINISTKVFEFDDTYTYMIREWPIN